MRYYTVEEVIKMANEFIEVTGNQKQVADMVGISPSYLSDILKGKRSPSDKLLRVLGLHEVTLYRKIEPEDVPAANTPAGDIPRG